MELTKNYKLGLKKLKVTKDLTVKQCIEKLNQITKKCDNFELSQDKKELLYFDIETETARNFYNEVFEGLTFDEYIDLFNVISEDHTDIVPLFQKINDQYKETIFINKESKTFKI